VLQRLTVPVVLVSNEVGLGIVPESSMGRRFRDLAGRLHQSLVGISDEVYLAILGTTLRLSPGPIEQVRP
jgi:adenosylcobinamide kinase/adenosylcobinamide-phosphate guanylyltransferase